MKKLSFLGKLIYGLNTLVAVLLLVSFILPYLPPKTFPLLSLLSLGVSPLLLVNVILALYWLVRLKKQFLVSFVVLVIAYFHFNPFIEFSSEVETAKHDNTIAVLSYNVRLFNAYEKNTSEEVVTKAFADLLAEVNPDVVYIQEFYADYTNDMADYPYHFIHFKEPGIKLGHAIFSKYPLINKGGFDFKDSYNNTIYADLLKGEDTLRLYNLHLQSIGILPSMEFLQKSGTDKITKRLSETFVMQEAQIKQILQHKSTTNHPVIMAGDFNNTSFSYAYKELKRDMNDAFLERGNGIGTTYSFSSYPMRIDYILGSKSLEVLRFTNGKQTFSDHYPVSATFGW